jgi:hypothetical protein
MLQDAEHNKGCGSQLLPEGEPTNEWGVEQLGVYAQVQYRQIVEEEKHLSCSYWRLGHALSLAKKAFAHGQWERYLEELGIDKTRASKARAIFRTFADEKDVRELSVEAAYAQRRRPRTEEAKECGTAATAPKKEVEAVRRSVSKLAERTGDVIHAAAFAAPKEALVLIPAVRKAIRQLEELLGYLEQQAAHAPAGESAEETGPKTSAVE